MTIGTKKDHVRAARGKPHRKHTCHWPDCPKQVPPAMWGCYQHWMILPKALRDLIWASYKPGQEETMTPSTEYIVAAEKVQEWIANYTRKL